MIWRFKNEYRWLSNFTPCTIILNGITYPSVEHAYMSAKSDDVRWYLKCADESIKPGAIKKMSRGILLVRSWDLIKIDVMWECLNQKFRQEPYKTMLIETGNAFIQEGNFWGDTFWGVDLNSKQGENRLGKMIMEIREKLQADLPKFCPFSSDDMKSYFRDVFDIQFPNSFTTSSTLHANAQNGREVMQCDQGCSRSDCRKQFDQWTILYLPEGKQHGFPMKTSEMREFWEKTIKSYYAIGFHSSGMMNNDDFYYIRIDKWRKVYLRLFVSGAYSTFQKEDTARFIEQFSQFEEQIKGLVDYFEVQQVKSYGKYKVTFGETTIEESITSLADNVFERLLDRIIN